MKGIVISILFMTAGLLIAFSSPVQSKTNCPKRSALSFSLNHEQARPHHAQKHNKNIPAVCLPAVVTLDMPEASMAILGTPIIIKNQFSLANEGFSFQCKPEAPYQPPQ